MDPRAKETYLLKIFAISGENLFHSVVCYAIFFSFKCALSSLNEIIASTLCRSKDIIKSLLLLERLQNRGKLVLS